jgi:hypothetical protein
MNISDARVMGAKAFLAGRDRAPVLNQDFLIAAGGSSVGGLALFMGYMDGWEVAFRAQEDARFATCDGHELGRLVIDSVRDNQHPHSRGDSLSSAMTYRVYVRLPEGKVSEKTSTESPTVAALAYAELVARASELTKAGAIGIAMSKDQKSVSYTELAPSK